MGLKPTKSTSSAVSLSEQTMFCFVLFFKENQDKDKVRMGVDSTQEKKKNTKSQNKMNKACKGSREGVFQAPSLDIGPLGKHT